MRQNVLDNVHLLFWNMNEKERTDTGLAFSRCGDRIAMLL